MTVEKVSSCKLVLRSLQIQFLCFVVAELCIGNDLYRVPCTEQKPFLILT